MKWINTRGEGSDEALKWSIKAEYSLPKTKIRGNQWMNLDNGDTIWMFFDRERFRFFRHVSVSNATTEITGSVTQEDMIGPFFDAQIVLQPAAEQCEAFIDRLLDAHTLSNFAGR